MEKSTKTTLYIGGGIIVLGAILYYLHSKNSTTQSSNTSESATGLGAISASGAGLIPIGTYTPSPVADNTGTSPIGGGNDSSSSFLDQISQILNPPASGGGTPDSVAAIVNNPPVGNPQAGGINDVMNPNGVPGGVISGGAGFTNGNLTTYSAAPGVLTVDNQPSLRQVISQGQTSGIGAQEVVQNERANNKAALLSNTN